MRKRYFITCKSKDSDQLVLREVRGEHVFSYRDFDFFIRRSEDAWIVSGVSCGTEIFRGTDRENVIAQAKQKVENEYDRYVKVTEKAPKFIYLG